MKPRVKIDSKQALEQYFEECIREHGKALLNYIYSLVKHKELAEDLYQEVLISAYIAFPSFEERAKVKSWLFTIAMNKCRDYWRKEKNTKVFWEEKVYMYVNDTNGVQLPEETVIDQCNQKEMKDTLKELPKIYSEPLLLFYYYQQTLMEISTKTKLPLSTVKTRMKRAKDRLRPKVEQLVVNV